MLYVVLVSTINSSLGLEIFHYYCCPYINYINYLCPPPPPPSPPDLSRGKQMVERCRCCPPHTSHCPPHTSTWSTPPRPHPRPRDSRPLRHRPAIIQRRLVLVLIRSSTWVSLSYSLTLISLSERAKKTSLSL